MQQLCNFCPPLLTIFSILLPQAFYVFPYPPIPNPLMWSLLALVAIPTINQLIKKIKIKKFDIIRKIFRKSLFLIKIKQLISVHDLWIQIFCVEYEPVKTKLMIDILGVRLVILNLRLSDEKTPRFVFFCTIARQVTFSSVTRWKLPHECTRVGEKFTR